MRQEANALNYIQERKIHYENTVHLLVISGFGRKAALDFLERAEKVERKKILASHSQVDFYDEYRRTSISLYEDLRYFKKDVLGPFISQNHALDDSVMVGFPGGMAISDVAPLVGRAVLEECSFPIMSGTEKIMTAIPCNTLSPLAHLLEDTFNSEEKIRGLVEDTNPPVDDKDERIMEIASQVEMRFPSVAEAVLENAEEENVDGVLPLGTESIARTYREASERLESSPEVLEVPESLSESVLGGIRTCLKGEENEIIRARDDIKEEISRLSNTDGREIMVVEACTDLDLGLGVDSLEIYADQVIDEIYSS